MCRKKVNTTGHSQAGLWASRMAGLMVTLIFLVVNFRLATSQGASCQNNNYFGVNDVQDYDDNDDNTYTGKGFLSTQNSYEINCCGVVDRWRIEADGGTATVVFQVWRPTASTDVYDLVGEASLAVSSSGQKSLTTTGSQRITVMSGDKWGWWTSGGNVVRYDTGGGSQWSQQTLGSVAVGASQDWSTASSVNSRTYGIRLDVDSNTDPTFSNVPASKTIVDTTAAGTSLHTVTVSDVDIDDVSTLSVVMTSNIQFSFNTTSLILSTATLTTVSGVENLEFVVSDQCGNSATATYTVTITSLPPTFENLPASANVSEDTTLETLLYKINVTDTNPVTCTMATSVPASYPFFLRLIGAGPEYGIYNSASPGFDYSTTSQYDLSVDCTDTVNTVTESFYVYVVPNATPVITNLQNATVISTTQTIGSTVFSVLTTDAENDNLAYTMTCDPAPCPFTIFASGDIQVSQDLSGYTTVGHDVSISVTDGRNTAGPLTLTVTFADINDPVTISNLPLGSSLSVTENTALATPVYTVSYADLDTSQAHTITMTSSPTSGLTYFTIDSTSGLITTAGSLLNYEALTTTSFTFTVTISDPVTSDTETLVIDVIDVNEAPTFSQSSFTLSADEGTAGTSLGTPTFGITDPDSGDSYTLSQACGASGAYFYMQPGTGEVTLQADYDLDTGVLHSTVSCNVTVTDATGLTDTADLTININDVNDNSPAFIPSSYSFYVSFYATTGTAVGTTTATDADSGAYGTLTYTLDQTSLGAAVFAIDTGGVISLLAAPQSSSAVNYSTSVTVSAIATDAGGLQTTANIIIVIADTTTTSTTTTTDEYRGFLDDPRNMGWFVPLAIVLTVILLLGAWLALTCHGKKGWRAFRQKWKNRRSRKFRKDNKLTAEPTATHFQDPTVRAAPPPTEMQPWRLQKSWL